MFKGVIPIGSWTDCNDLTDGFYSYTYPDIPLNVEGFNGVLLQLSRGLIHIQIKYDWNQQGLFFRRTDYYGNWQSWVPLHSGI